MSIAIVLVALFVIFIGYRMIVNKEHWTMNYETGKREPHPLGFALVIFGIFMFIMQIS
jgi:predicted tellurium resistance membrane protein TerC